MFGRNLPPSGDNPLDPPPEPTIPEPRVLQVTELADDNTTWHLVNYMAHMVQNTESGGLNLIRYVDVGNGMVGQHLVIGFAPGEWRRVREILEPNKTARITLH